MSDARLLQLMPQQGCRLCNYRVIYETIQSEVILKELLISVSHMDDVYRCDSILRHPDALLRTMTVLIELYSLLQR